MCFKRLMELVAEAKEQYMTATDKQDIGDQQESTTGSLTTGEDDGLPTELPPSPWQIFLSDSECQQAGHVSSQEPSIMSVSAPIDSKLNVFASEFVPSASFVSTLSSQR